MTGAGTRSFASQVEVSHTRCIQPEHRQGAATLWRHRETRVRHAPVPSSTSLFADNDVGRVGMFHSDDVIAGIDVMNLTRDAAREIAEEVHRGVSDSLDFPRPPQGRLVLVPFENVAKVADPRRR